MNTPRNLASSAVNRLAEDCTNIGKSIKLSATIVLIMVFIALILLVSAIIYNYVKKIDATTTDGQAAELENKKKKVVGGLTIASSVLLLLTSLAAIWDLSVVSKAANKCLSTL